MKKAITGMMSFVLIGFLLLPGIFPARGSQNEGGAWVLVEVINIDAAEDIERHNKDYEGIYHYEGSYSEGIFSLSTTYVGRSDDYYDPPMVNGEFVAFTAAFSTPPHVIYPNDEITINVLLSAADNHSFFTPDGSVRAQIGKSGQSFRDFTNENGEGSFISGIRNNYASINENVTAIAPGGAEGETLELRVYLYNGLKMETRYVYEWREAGGTVPITPEDEQPTATIEPTSTLGPTPTVCPAYTETEKLGYFLNLYYQRIPKGIMRSGITNNIMQMAGVKDLDEFTCGGYQGKVLNILNTLKFSKDPCARQVLDDWDYGPIQAFYGAHQAVVIYPKGTDWKSTGIVLDPWIEQTPDIIYRIDDWAKKMSLLNQNPISVILDSEPYFDGIGPSEVYRRNFNKYPIFGNDYEDSGDRVRFTEEELQYTSPLTPEELDVLINLPTLYQEQWIKLASHGDKIQKVIAHCPLNLYIMIESLYYG